MKQEIKLLEELARSLNVQIEFLWDTVVKQARVNFIVTTFQYLILAVGSYAYLKLIKKTISDDGDCSGLIISSIMFGFILIILLLCAFFYLPDYVASVVNPEYWALSKILSTVSSKK